MVQNSGADKPRQGGGRRLVRALAVLLLVSVFGLAAAVSAVVEHRVDLAAALEEADQARDDAADAVEDAQQLRERLAEIEVAAAGAQKAAAAAQEAADAAVERAVAAEETATAQEAAEARAAAERKAEKAREAAERAASGVVAAGGSCDMGADGPPVCEHEPNDDVPDDWVPCGETGAYCPPEEGDDTAGKTPVWDRQGNIEYLSDAEIDRLRDAMEISCEPASYEDEDAGLECWYLE